MGETMLEEVFDDWMKSARSIARSWERRGTFGMTREDLENEAWIAIREAYDVYGPARITKSLAMTAIRNRFSDINERHRLNVSARYVILWNEEEGADGARASLEEMATWEEDMVGSVSGLTLAERELLMECLRPSEVFLDRLNADERANGWTAVAHAAAERFDWEWDAAKLTACGLYAKLVDSLGRAPRQKIIAEIQLREKLRGIAAAKANSREEVSQMATKSAASKSLDDAFADAAAGGSTKTKPGKAKAEAKKEEPKAKGKSAAPAAKEAKASGKKAAPMKKASGGGRSAANTTITLGPRAGDDLPTVYKDIVGFVGKAKKGIAKQDLIDTMIKSGWKTPRGEDPDPDYLRGYISTMTGKGILVQTPID